MLYHELYLTNDKLSRMGIMFGANLVALMINLVGLVVDLIDMIGLG